MRTDAEVDNTTLKSGLFLSGFEPMTLAPSVKNDRLGVIWRVTLLNGHEDERRIAQALRDRTLSNILDSNF